MTLLIALMVAAPVPKAAAKPPSRWQPTVGTTLVFVIGPNRHTEVVTAAGPDGDRYTYSIEIDGRQKWRLESTATETYQLQDTGRQEVGFYKPGLAVGQQYTCTAEFGNPAADATHTVEALEDVEVPAGRFKAYRIRVTAGLQVRTYWFSYKAGLVRMEDQHGNTILHLDSYTPGR